MRKQTIRWMLLTIFALTLCGCASPKQAHLPNPTVEQIVTVPSYTEQPPTEQPIPPEFAQTPAKSETAIRVNGMLLPNSYMYENELYFKLEDFAEVTESSFTQTVGEGIDHTCALRVLGHSLSIYANNETLRDDHAVLKLNTAPIFDGTHWYLPTNKLLDYLGFSELTDEEQNTIYFTMYPKSDTIVAGKEIPVLMYHAVSDYCWGEAELFVSPPVLDEQITALLANGYTLITFEDLDRISEIDKPVMLTFDDGYDDNYSELFPILRKHQVKATVFMIVNDIGKNHKLTEEELIEMSESGLVSIQSHTMSHAYLSYQNAEQLDYELFASKLALARLTGKEPFVLCYPTGMYSQLSLEKTAEYYEYGLLMSKGLYVTGEDPVMIPRYYVSRWLSADSLLEKIG